MGDALKSCFPPVIDGRTRLLILGSLPGEASLAARRYYAHPQNQFWRLCGAALGIDLAALGYQARLAALRDRGVGLWDMIGAARRQGSLDGAIRDARRNDLASVAATLPALRAAAFNGKTAARLGRAALSGTSLVLIDLPSSSPALTTALDIKLHAWRALAPFVS